VTQQHNAEADHLALLLLALGDGRK